MLATLMDSRLEKTAEAKCLLDDLSDANIQKAEDYITVMKEMYTATLSVSAKNKPTVTLVLPLHAKLLFHFTCSDNDSSFAKHLKNAVYAKHLHSTKTLRYAIFSRKHLEWIQGPN